MPGRHAATKSPLRFSAGVKFLAVLALFGLLGGGWLIVDRTTGSTPTEPVATEPSTTGVDTVVKEVVIASARLANYQSADADRRPVILARAAENLTRAANTLSTDALPDVSQVAAQQAEDLILDLASRVDRMLQCARVSAAAPDPTADPAADPCTDPTVLAEDAAAARAVGTAVAALRQSGSLSEQDVRAYAEKVADQARTEGAAGSTTDIDAPTR